MNWLLCHLQLSVGQENKSFCSKYNRAFQQAEWIWAAEDQLLASRKRNHRNSQKYYEASANVTDRKHGL